jgi:Transposase IS116/IS110/IS902 family
LRGLGRRIEIVEKQIVGWGRDNQTCRHLITIPGDGPILSSAMTAFAVDPAAFASGWHFSASLGLVPRQDGTGGKVKLGPISKRGNGYLRRLRVNGAMSVLCSKRAKEDPWLVKLLETKERKIAAGALANKMARIGWAVMTRQQDFRRRRHDQPCPDLGQPGTVLPTGPRPWAEGPRRQDRCARLRRWPRAALGASLDSGGARRHSATRSGRRNGPVIEQRNRLERHRTSEGEQA